MLQNLSRRLTPDSEDKYSAFTGKKSRVMTDENGNEIDLDLVDAIGRFEDGRFDVWLADGTRTVTARKDAFEAWREHIRSKVRRNPEFNVFKTAPEI